MRSQRAPTLTITFCDDDSGPESGSTRAAATLRRWDAGLPDDDEDALPVPLRAETRIERLSLARLGIATGSFKMNCAETPFLRDSAGRTFVERLELNGLPIEARGTMERPISTAPPVSFAPPKSRKSSAHTRSNSLDISWPRKLGRTVLTRRENGSGGMSRSATVAFDLADLGPRGPPRSSTSTLRRKVADSISKFRDADTIPHSSGIRTGLAVLDGSENQPPSPHYVKASRIRRKHTHTRARSLDTDAFKPPLAPPASKTVAANLHRLAHPESGPALHLGSFSPSASLQSYSSSNSISRSLHQLSASASTLKRKLLSSLQGYFNEGPHKPDSPDSL